MPEKILPLEEEDIIKLLLHNADVCREAVQYLSEEYFSSYWHRWLYRQIEKYYEKYGSCFSKRAFDAEVAELEDKESYVTALEGLFQLGGLADDFQFSVDKLLMFIKKQKIFSAVRQSIKCLEEKDVDAAQDALQQCLVGAGKKRIEVHDWVSEWREREEKRRSIIEDKSQHIIIPTMLADDKIDFDNVLGGGVWGGELASVFAPTKRGKSIFLLHIAFVAFFFGKRNVLYVTLEAGVDLILRRMDSRFLDISAKKIKLYDLSEEERRNADAKFEKLCGYDKRIKVVEYDRSCNVVALLQLLRKLEMEGFKCECLILDYADIMSPVKSTGNKIDDMIEVFWDLKTLAREEGIVVWTAMQSTASSSKRAILDWSDTADSKGRVRVLDILMSLNQTVEEKLVDTMRIGLPIYRDGESGMFITINTDFERIRLIR